MSDKAFCRSCETLTSSVETAANDGQPCPYCGASNSELISQAERDEHNRVDQEVGTTVHYGVRLPDGKVVSHRMVNSFSEAMAYRERLCGEAKGLGVVEYSATVVTRSIVRTETTSNWVPVTDEASS